MTERFVITMHMVSATTPPPRKEPRIEISPPDGCDPLPVTVTAVGRDHLAFVWRRSDPAAGPAAGDASATIRWTEGADQPIDPSVAWMAAFVDGLARSHKIAFGASDMPLYALRGTLRTLADRIYVMPVGPVAAVDSEFKSIDDLCMDACLTAMRVACKALAIRHAADGEPDDRT